MKAKLIKTDVNYLLRDEEDVIIASSSFKTAGISLSKQNCDEIFGVVDVEKLAEENTHDCDTSGCYPADYFIAGFNKAMELNKDIVFTLEDMKNAFYNGWNYRGEDYQWPTAIKEYLQHLRQLNEIEVEIVKESIGRVKLGVGSQLEQMMPKLDSNGCLILKKI